MLSNKIYHIVTSRDTHYVLEGDDGKGNIPSKMLQKKGYYEIHFTHGRFITLVHDAAYCFKGSWEKNRPFYQQSEKVKPMKKGRGE